MFRLPTLVNNARRQDCRSLVIIFKNKKHVWTSEKVIKSPFKDVEIPNLTVTEYIWRNLDKWATKTATVCGVTDRQYTYEQIYKQSQILGANLRKKFRIENDDAVAVMLPNLPEYPTIMLAILNAGGLVSTINPIYTPFEISRQLTTSNAKLIFAFPDIVPVVREALKLSKKDIPQVVINLNDSLPEGTISFNELVEDNHVDISILKQVNRSVEDVAFLLYSSGTTGLPKGVELTNKNLVVNFEQQTTECRPYQFTTESNQDCSLVSLPIFHSYGLNVSTLQKMSAGLKLVTVPRFRPDIMIDVLSKYSINFIQVAPPTVSFFGLHPEVLPKHFERLRGIMSGGAPLPQVDIDRFLSKASPDAHFVQGYGLTETAPVSTLSPLGYKDYTKVGFPLPNIELRVVDNQLNNLGPNEIGELLIKGPNVMKGYKDNPEANKEIFLENRWMRTGDLAKIDKDGSVTIVDRLKELIKVNAFQVPPAEIESVCKEHPAVFDAAVVAIPDVDTGEKPKAFIVLKDNVKATDKDIINFVAERLAPYKRIKEVAFIDSIPKNPSGKILRRVIKEKYC
ncbi:uncharacterized protein [Battus philenor]|uniref:uncharacterized protein n=1 Tax=Battus philenor TaxID=42288 RepID=UPI0035CFB247